MGVIGVDGTTGRRQRTWRNDTELLERLRRDREYWTPPRRARSHNRLLGFFIASSFLNRVLLASLILIAISIGLRLPWGAGERLEQFLQAILTNETTLETVAATIRRLAYEGRQWAVNNLDYESLPALIPGTGDAEGDQTAVSWVWPVEGPVVSAFGWRQNAAGDDEFHYGVDIGAAAGELVVAAAPGVVVREWSADDGAGRNLEIQHAGGWVSRYFHLQSTYVAGGDTVAAGDVIGEVADSVDEKPARLHFELLLDGKHVDPEPKLRRGSGQP